MASDLMLIIGSSSHYGSDEISPSALLTLYDKGVWVIEDFNKNKEVTSKEIIFLSQKPDDFFDTAFFAINIFLNPKKENIDIFTKNYMNLESIKNRLLEKYSKEELLNYFTSSDIDENSFSNIIFESNSLTYLPDEEKIKMYNLNKEIGLEKIKIVLVYLGNINKNNLDDLGKNMYIEQFKRKAEEYKLNNYEICVSVDRNF